MGIYWKHDKDTALGVPCGQVAFRRFAHGVLASGIQAERAGHESLLNAPTEMNWVGKGIWVLLWLWLWCILR